MAMRPGPVVPLPAKEVMALGAVGSVPAGVGVVVGDELPYLPDALTQKKKNQEGWLALDPEIKCYLPGVPRATYMPFPFQIFQSDSAFFIAYEYASAVRNIYLKDPGPPPVDSWMGQSWGRWEGDTFVVESSGFNDQTWFDRAGNFHSEQMTVVERYTMTDRDHIQYEATITDPKVFSRPWTMRMPLYRHVNANARLGQFKCVEFVEELMFGKFRKVAGELGADRCNRCGQVRTGAGRCGQVRTGADRCGGVTTMAERLAGASGRWWWRRPRCGRWRRWPGRRRPASRSRGRCRGPADGHPDLQGNWTNATITPIDRPQGAPPVYTERRRGAWKRATRIAWSGWRSRAIPNRPAPPQGGDGSTGAAGNVGGYNNFWVDPGDRVAVVNGEYRSSLIVDPPNGRPPELSEAGKARAAARAEWLRTRGGEYDHPEFRPLAERCLMSFGSNAGPPMLPNYFYNNNYQIVQTKDQILILVEMVHDVRVIRMNATDPPAGAHPDLDGRFDRALGGRYAGGGDDELPPAAGLPRRVGEAEGHRALHAGGCGDDPLQVHDRRSGHLVAPVERRGAVPPVRGADLRVRVPRRQLRPLEHPERRPRPGARGGDEEAAEVGTGK